MQQWTWRQTGDWQNKKRAVLNNTYMHTLMSLLACLLECLSTCLCAYLLTHLLTNLLAYFIIYMTRTHYHPPNGMQHPLAWLMRLFALTVCACLMTRLIGCGIASVHANETRKHPEQAIQTLKVYEINKLIQHKRWDALNDTVTIWNNQQMTVMVFS